MRLGTIFIGPILHRRIIRVKSLQHEGNHVAFKLQNESTVLCNDWLISSVILVIGLTEWVEVATHDLMADRWLCFSQHVVGGV